MCISKQIELNECLNTNIDFPPLAIVQLTRSKGFPENIVCEIIVKNPHMSYGWEECGRRQR